MAGMGRENEMKQNIKTFTQDSQSLIWGYFIKRHSDPSSSFIYSHYSVLRNFNLSNSLRVKNKVSQLHYMSGTIALFHITIFTILDTIQYGRRF
jgi:hypothetical protein